MKNPSKLATARVSLVCCTSAAQVTDTCWVNQRCLPWGGLAEEALILCLKHRPFYPISFLIRAELCICKRCWSGLQASSVLSWPLKSWKSRTGVSLPIHTKFSGWQKQILWRTLITALLHVIDKFKGTFVLRMQDEHTYILWSPIAIAQDDILEPYLQTNSWCGCVQQGPANCGVHSN